jgi:hypothetical protein
VTREVETTRQTWTLHAGKRQQQPHPWQHTWWPSAAACSTINITTPWHQCVCHTFSLALALAIRSVVSKNSNSRQIHALHILHRFLLEHLLAVIKLKAIVCGHAAVHEKHSLSERQQYPDYLPTHPPTHPPTYLPTYLWSYHPKPPNPTCGHTTLNPQNLPVVISCHLRLARWMCWVTVRPAALELLPMSLLVPPLLLLLLLLLLPLLLLLM